jgi:hypothetical protein
MDFTDKEIVCRDCGTSFMWSAGEQEFFTQKGLVNTPSRCPICRKKKDVKHDFQHLFDIECRLCHKKSRSPFQPNDAAQAICEACFKQQQADLKPVSSEQVDHASVMESQY